MNTNFSQTIFARYVLSGLIVTLLSTFSQAAVMNLSGLQAVTVWEITGSAASYSFLPSGTAITTQLGVGVLGPSSSDFSPLLNENYDVFYSDVNGNVNPNGNFLTVEAVYTNPQGGGGLNLGAVDLVFTDGTICRADILASFVGLGPNYSVGSEVLAVDPDTPVPTTFTAMGSTVTPPTQHLRVTVGWSKIPEPGTLVLGSIGVFGLLWRRRK